MAFFWAGYHLQFGYTHRLMNLGDEKALWAGLRTRLVTDARKAENETVINTGRSLGDFISILEKTYHRQRKDFSASFPVLEQIDDAMRVRNQCRLYCAEDAKGQIRPAVYVVFDERHCFYLGGGGDPALRGSGAHGLAMWHAIIDAGKAFAHIRLHGIDDPADRVFRAGLGVKRDPPFFCNA